MVKNKMSILLLALLILIGMAITACGDIGPAPDQFPAQTIVHSGITGGERAHVLFSKEEWNAYRFDIFFDLYTHAGYK